MNVLNVEIKARTNQQDKIRTILQERNADYIGKDHQIDTYFVVPNGRLKLRQGNIENTLIFYNRTNQQGPKSSNCQLYKADRAQELHTTLTSALDVLAVVDKQREIYFIENIKFHIDVVEGLGEFIEIEASNKIGDYTQEQLQVQCEEYMKLFGIKDEDLISVSYSDLVIKA